MRRSGVLGVGVCVLLLAGGCTGEEQDPGPPRPEAAVKGELVDAAAFVDALEQSFEDASARVSFDVGGHARLHGHGVVDYRPDGMDVDVRMEDWQVEGGWVELRVVDGATFLRVPESRGLWVDLGAGGDGFAADVMAGADPRDQFAAYAEDGAAEVRFSGDDTIAGRPARRYQVVVDEAVLEYWLDAEGRVVRRRTDLGGAGSAQFSWSAWGAPGDIAAPPPGRVITLRALERLRKQQADRP